MLYRFADSEVDTARFELRCRGSACKVEPQVFEILCHLVARHGQFVGKEELHRAVWQGRIVSDATIASRIKAARRAIGDDGKSQHLIRTVHGRGFCFVAPVVSSDNAAVDSETSARPAENGAASAAATPCTPPVPAVLSADSCLRILLDGDFAPQAAEQSLLSWRNALRGRVEQARGRIIDLRGGGVSALYAEADDAIRCAVDLQSWASSFDSTRAIESAPLLRVGVCAAGDDQAQAAVLAARLQCAASPGQSCVAESCGAFEAVAEMRSESSIGPTWVALCHWTDFTRGWSDRPAQSRALARRWADVAAGLPDADGQAHTVLAHVRLLERDFDGALRAGREALDIRPGCANANGFFGIVLHYCGEQPQAIWHLPRGIRLARLPAALRGPAGRRVPRHRAGGIGDGRGQGGPAAELARTAGAVDGRRQPGCRQCGTRAPSLRKRSSNRMPASRWPLIGRGNRTGVPSSRWHAPGRHADCRPEPAHQTRSLWVLAHPQWARIDRAL